MDGQYAYAYLLTNEWMAGWMDIIHIRHTHTYTHAHASWFSLALHGAPWCSLAQLKTNPSRVGGRGGSL